MGLRDDGVGRPRGRRARAHDERRARPRAGRGRRRRPTVRPTTSWRTRRCGTATTISSTCRAGPGSTATGGRRGTATARYNRAVAGAVADRADEGATVLVQDYHFSLLGRMLAESPARPADRALPPHAVRRPEHARRPARRRARRSCWTAWPATAPAASTATAGRRASAPASPTAGRPAPPHVRGAARARRRRRSSPRRRRRRAPGGRGAASRGRRAPHCRAGRPHGAVEEHRARDAGLRGAACRRTRSGAARWCTLALAYPSRQGLAEYLAYGSEVEHTAERINHAFASSAPASASADVVVRRWTPIVLLVDDDRGRSLAALVHLRRAARQPRARRAQPGGQGGPAAQPERRRAGALARSRGLGGALSRWPGRARREPLRRDGDGRGRCTRPCRCPPPSAPSAPPRCGPPSRVAPRPTGGPISWPRRARRPDRPPARLGLASDRSARWRGGTGARPRPGRAARRPRRRRPAP